MEGNANPSSLQDANKFGGTLNKDINEINMKAVTVKAELVDIKKESDLCNYIENTFTESNVYDTKQDKNLLKSKNYHFKFNDNIENSSKMQIQKDTLKLKEEDLALDNYNESDNQSIANFDIKQENMDYYNPPDFMGKNKIFNQTFTTEYDTKFTEEIESLDENVDFNVENESAFMEMKMFGISEMFNFTSEEVIKCKYCNFETKHKNQLWGHMQIHNDSLNSKSQDVTLYKCPYPQCKFQTVYKYSITKHLNTHKTQKYKCSKCSYVTLQLKKYDQHIKSCEKVPEGTLLQCDQCDFKVKTQGLLLVHKRRHKDESKLLKCTECDLTTMYASALKKHMEKHRREENHLFTCAKCSYRSPSKTMLMRHEKVHGNEEDGEGKYQCSDCSFQTMSLDELESHMIEHKDDKSGEIDPVEGSSKMYYCPECSFKTSVISKAKHHKNLHIRQRNGEIYKCEHCKYETMYKYLLKRHSLKHKDTDSIKTYPCDLCDYRAKLKDYLVRHKRTHMKKQLQQYKCTVCSFETIYKHTFKEHLARHNISLVDVKKFLSDKPDTSEAGNVFVSEEVVELQNVLKYIVPTNIEKNLDSEVT